MSESDGSRVDASRLCTGCCLDVPAASPGQDFCCGTIPGRQSNDRYDPLSSSRNLH